MVTLIVITITTAIVIFTKESRKANSWDENPLQPKFPLHHSLLLLHTGEALNNDDGRDNGDEDHVGDEGEDDGESFDLYLSWLFDDMI